MLQSPKSGPVSGRFAASQGDDPDCAQRNVFHVALCCIFLLTPKRFMSILMDMKKHSTQEVADAIGVSKKTLLRWLYAGVLAEPKHATFGGVESRIWSADDLERARAYKEQNYRKRS